MTTMRALFLGSALAGSAFQILFGVACATGDAATKGAGDYRAENAAVRIADDTFDPNCCTKRDYDLNRDGKPDSYQFVKVVDGQGVVVRKENDVNADGKIDLVRTLSDDGQLVDERLDTDFDGKIDLVVYFERGIIVKKGADTNFDSKIDKWRYYEKDTLAREEADLNYDGRVDYWEYFEGGRLDRVGIDRDGDGNVDEWLQAQSEG